MEQREKKKSNNNKLHRNDPESVQKGKSKKSREKKKINFNSQVENEILLEKGRKTAEADAYPTSLDNGGPSKGMKSKDKKALKKRKKEDCNKMEAKNAQKKNAETDANDAYLISSGDEDSSKGMKKWIVEYHQSRPGLKVLQQRIDEFIEAHEAQLEQERKEREAHAAEGGWTVVVRHKGRKKTTDAETGITVGSVAPAAVEDKMSKKKRKDVGLDFYRFQRREAQRNEVMMLQSKFEQDKKRIQQLRAARKFRPY